MKSTEGENKPGEQVPDKDGFAERFVSYHKELVDGFEFNVPVTEDGKLLLWRCLPNCGRCCHPSSLSILPRQAEGMKARGAKVRELPPPNMPQLEEPRDGRRCPWLAGDMKCGVYDDRPHSCRIYPFQYSLERKVGYLTSEFSVCPGFYLADDVDAATLETWKVIAAESNDGVAFYDEKIAESMKSVGGLINMINAQTPKNGSSD